jgi:hypothetical protein
MPVVTAKEERGDSAIELLVLLKGRHLMHAPAPRRTSSSWVALFGVRQNRGLGRTGRGG